MTRSRWILLVVLLLSGGAILWVRLDADAPVVPQLITAEVSRGEVVAGVAATGTLEPVDTVEVGSQVSGTIKTLSADFNSPVRQGQVIATLDPALIDSQIAQAAATVQRLEADLERARIESLDADQKLARARQLAAARLIAETDLETAETTARLAKAAIGSAQAQITQARASLAQSRVNRSHTIIRSPVDGIVLSRNVEVGQTVAAGLQAPVLFRIARDLAVMQVNASVDESQIGAVQPNQTATFQVDAYGNETFGGTVRQIRLQPTVVQNVVNYTVVIDVANPTLRLKPGMTATIDIETGRAENALRVPAAALRFKPSADVLAAYAAEDAGAAAASRNGDATRASGTAASAPASTRTAGSGRAPDTSANRAAVWQLAGGRLQRVPVQTGVAGGTFVEIVGGALEPGARIVTGATSSATAAPTQTSGSPLVPTPPRRTGGRTR
jgi:HlyD family secretion protein